MVTVHALLALDWIADSDLKQAKSYLAVRNERLDEAAAVMDRHPNRQPTVNGATSQTTANS